MGIVLTDVDKINNIKVEKKRPVKGVKVIKLMYKLSGVRVIRGASYLGCKLSRVQVIRGASYPKYELSGVQLNRILLYCANFIFNRDIISPTLFGIVVF